MTLWDFIVDAADFILLCCCVPALLLVHMVCERPDVQKGTYQPKAPKDFKLPTHVPNLVSGITNK